MTLDIQNWTSRTKLHEEEGLVISERFFHIYQIIVFGVINQSIVMFGTISNTINIICFIKQGFKDAVNVSFFGLAISDLGCLATYVFSNLCLSTLLQDMDLSFDPIPVQYLTTSWPHVIFSRITGWITALITLERCLCVTMPLKVKTILTPGRVALAIVLIYVVLTACGSSLYFGSRLEWTYSPLRNKTILGLVGTPDRTRIDALTFGLNTMALPYVSFVFVIICTVILVVNMKRKAKWRQTSTVAEQAKATGNRDQRVARMVVCLSALFIACFFPICIATMIMVLIPGLSVDGKYRNILLVAAGWAAILESANSAMNIFIYYKMSSKYRAVFHEIFGITEKGQS